MSSDGSALDPSVAEPNSKPARQWLATSTSLPASVSSQTALDFAEDCVRCDSEDFLGKNRVVCHECGLTSAVPQWVHPDEEGGPCEGTLEGLEVRAYGRSGLYVGWPFARRYLSAAELAEAYSE